MLPRTIALPSAVLAMAMLAGCNAGSRETTECAQYEESASTETASSSREYTSMSADWPSRAAPGECWAKVFIPPKSGTVSERVMLHEASEKVEVIPARYEWVEEQRLVKEACTELREVPAQYKTVEKTIEVEPAKTSWVLGKTDCKTAEGQVAPNVYCLVTQPAVTKTIQQQCLCAPARVTEVAVPAKYETVRREKLVCPATTRRTSIPAEFDTIQKTVVVAPGRWEWQQVICEPRASADKLNLIKTALAKAGYKTGPQDGSLDLQDWNSIRAFQLKNELAVGGLTFETLNKLGVPPETFQTSSR
jgi:hypothetical protein